MDQRTDENGYVVPRKGDWIHVDWFDMDKEGILCSEQILMWYAHKTMGRLAVCLGEDSSDYEEKEIRLKSRVMNDFWDEEKELFLFDRFRRHVNL